MIRPSAGKRSGVKLKDKAEQASAEMVKGARRRAKPYRQGRNNGELWTAPQARSTPHEQQPHGKGILIL